MIGTFLRKADWSKLDLDLWLVFLAGWFGVSDLNVCDWEAVKFRSR